MLHSELSLLSVRTLLNARRSSWKEVRGLASFAPQASLDTQHMWDVLGYYAITLDVEEAHTVVCTNLRDIELSHCSNEQ